MNKKDLSERDICSMFVGPAVKRAGWDGMTQIRMEVAFTKGRIIVRGKLVSRGKAKRRAPARLPRFATKGQRRHDESRRLTMRTHESPETETTHDGLRRFFHASHARGHGFDSYRDHHFFLANPQIAILGSSPDVQDMQFDVQFGQRTRRLLHGWPCGGNSERSIPVADDRGARSTRSD
jgi:hypothetical protein